MPKFLQKMPKERNKRPLRAGRLKSSSVVQRARAAEENIESLKNRLENLIAAQNQRENSHSNSDSESESEVTAELEPPKKKGCHHHCQCQDKFWF